MKQCVNRDCRETLKDEAKFCRYCGSPQVIDVIEAKWRPLLDRLEVPILGVKEVPLSPTRSWVDGTEWITSSLNSSSITRLPPETYDRVQELEAEGLSFEYWVLLVEQPKPIPVPEPTDPVLIGVISTGENQGIWCKLGAWLHK